MLLALAVVVVALSAAPAAAQGGPEAGLAGTVVDGSGAVVPGATITVSSRKLIGGSQSTTTDRQGGYRLPYLPPGTYDVAARRDAFKTMQRTGIELVPGLTFTVDFRLEPSDVAETVVVRAAAPVIDVRTSASPVVIDRPLLQNLPLSRAATDAVNLAPGVIHDVAFGGSVRANPFTLDAASGNEAGWGTPIVTPNLNWFEELQIVSLGADAQSGEFTGAQAHAITRSGSDRFSGFGDYWTTRTNWTGDNRGTLAPALAPQFSPLQIFDRWDSDAQLGGPIAKNRLWFFSGGEVYRDVTRPAGFSGLPPTPNEPRSASDEQKFLGKLTAAASSRARAEGYVMHDTLGTTGLGAGPLVEPEAVELENHAETLWSARLLWTLRPNAFLEVQHGGHDLNNYTGPPTDRLNGPPGHYDQVTGISSANAGGTHTTWSRPITTAAHFTYLATGPRGQSHDLRIGYEYERARLRTADTFIGNEIFYDSEGQPDTVVFWNGSIYRPAHQRQTIYVQDGWAVADRVTLNIGVRTGFYSGSVPGRANAFSNHSVSPRFGAAWDVTGNHRTVVRVHFGRYHDEMVTSFYDFLDPLSQSPMIEAAVLGPGVYQTLFTSGNTSSAAIDPDTKFPHVDEFLGGIERQLPFGLSIKAQYIDRDFKDSIGFIDTGRSWSPVQRTDPGPDGRLGTADDGGAVTVFYQGGAPALLMTNPAGAYRRYRGVQVVGTKRYTHDVEFLAAYTWSHTVASYNNSFSSNAATGDLGGNGVFVNPNRAINAEGRTPQDFTNEVKLLGTYRLERWGGLNVSAVYRYQSGRGWARCAGFGGRTGILCVFVEPRATRQMPATNTVDLRVEKTWTPFGGPATISLFGDAFNLTNQGVATSMVNTSGPRFGIPSTWSDPRTVRAGARLFF